MHYHDDVIKWKHFPRYWPFVRGIHRSPVNSQHKGQWHRTFMFSLICAWINRWVNNREADDLRRYRAHYDVIVMLYLTGRRHGSVPWVTNTQGFYNAMIGARLFWVGFIVFKNVVPMEKPYIYGHAVWFKEKKYIFTGNWDPTGLYVPISVTHDTYAILRGGKMQKWNNKSDY